MHNRKFTTFNSRNNHSRDVNHNKQLMKSNTKYNIEELFEIYSKTKTIIQDDFNSQINFDHVNPFWTNILSKRENFPSFTDTLSFLNNNSAFGLGKRMEGELESERESFKDAVLAVNKEKFNSLKDKLSESLIGFPKYFETDSLNGSTSFIENIISTHRLINAIDKHLSVKKKINILEIGAGWGAVMNQLIQHYGDRINKIAICDLHENLFISSFHLQSVFPDRNVDFIPQNESISGQDFSLIFCSPNRIENLDIEFDLIFNMISFQEMNLDVIDNYMLYIQNHLSKDGIVYSENGVQVKNPNKLAEKASDYGYSSNFKILSLQNGARFCPHLYFGNKHEILLCHKNESDVLVNPKHLDALCFIMNLRLDDNINEIKANTISGKNSPQEIEILELLHDFFDTSDKSTKQVVLKKLEQSSNILIHQYLLALYYISQKKFKKAFPILISIEPELSGLVKINVLCYIGIIDKTKQTGILEQVKMFSPEMLTTAKATFNTRKKSKRNMVDKITKQLNLDVKKWLGYSSYQLSFLPSILKNRILNKVELKVVKMKQKNTIPFYLK